MDLECDYSGQLITESESLGNNRTWDHLHRGKQAQWGEWLAQEIEIRMCPPSLPSLPFCPKLPAQSWAQTFFFGRTSSGHISYTHHFPSRKERGRRRQVMTAKTKVWPRSLKSTDTGETQQPAEVWAAPHPPPRPELPEARGRSALEQTATQSRMRWEGSSFSELGLVTVSFTFWWSSLWQKCHDFELLSHWK